jgi:ribosomal protein L21E
MGKGKLERKEKKLNKTKEQYFETRSQRKLDKYAKTAGQVADIKINETGKHNKAARQTEGTKLGQVLRRTFGSNRVQSAEGGEGPIFKKLSASCKAAAKKKFKVYPSAYANIWASKQQKKGKC